MIDANIGSVSMISPEARDSSAVMKKLASSTVSAQRRICRLRPFLFLLLPAQRAVGRILHK